MDASIIIEDDLNDGYVPLTPWKRRAIIYMALINCGTLLNRLLYFIKVINYKFVFLGVFFALGALTMWHSHLIGRGETSIEANINKAETKRLQQFNKSYVNPYNFGQKKNWKIFLGLVQGRYVNIYTFRFNYQLFNIVLF